MTLEQILDCSAAQLEVMSDEQLLEHFKPYLCVTRPELAPKPQRKESTYVSPEDFAVRQKVMQLQAIGIDLSAILKPTKRRYAK